MLFQTDTETFEPKEPEYMRYCAAYVCEGACVTYGSVCDMRERV